MIVENEKYIPTDISGFENELYVKVYNYIQLMKDVDADEIEMISDLNTLKKYVQDCVSYVNENIPVGLDRVDGYCIRPILNEVVNNEIESVMDIESVIDIESELEV